MIHPNFKQSKPRDGKKSGDGKRKEREVKYNLLFSKK